MSFTIVLVRSCVRRFLIIVEQIAFMYWYSCDVQKTESSNLKFSLISLEFVREYFEQFSDDIRDNAIVMDIEFPERVSWKEREFFFAF